MTTRTGREQSSRRGCCKCPKRIRTAGRVERPWRASQFGSARLNRRTPPPFHSRLPKAPAAEGSPWLERSHPRRRGRIVSSSRSRCVSSRNSRTAGWRRQGHPGVRLCRATRQFDPCGGSSRNQGAGAERLRSRSPLAFSTASNCFACEGEASLSASRSTASKSSIWCSARRRRPT